MIESWRGAKCCSTAMFCPRWHPRDVQTKSGNAWVSPRFICTLLPALQGDLVSHNPVPTAPWRVWLCKAGLDHKAILGPTQKTKTKGGVPSLDVFSLWPDETAFLPQKCFLLQLVQLFACVLFIHVFISRGLEPGFTPGLEVSLCHEFLPGAAVGCQHQM